MARDFSLWGSTVGKKIAMAVSGVILLGFVVGHMVGNLKVYQGADAFNHYAEGLRTFGDPFFGNSQLLWLIRLVLLAALLVHISAAFQLTRRSRAARAVGYTKYDNDLAFSYASRTMVWGGVIILLFVLYHLLHLTFGTAHPDFIHGDAYHNFVVGFRSVPVSLAYIAAMIPLGLHMYHGFWSMLQTLGANNPAYARFRRPVAAFLAIIVVVGNISFPVAVLTGILS
ncbi:MAG TPA: succinate dehydrogenase cytochrome b subunit [Longimicrobiales bacterium]|nr:succinate dehydrogenase cytochrome b subunit [Longimicrobiales bacterium]